MAAVPFWQIGSDSGFLPKPIRLDELMIAPGERLDVLVDLTGVPADTTLYLINEGPDKPFGPAEFPTADPGTTGQVMRLTVSARASVDTSAAPETLSLPTHGRLGPASRVRPLSLNERAR